MSAHTLPNGDLQIMCESWEEGLATVREAVASRIGEYGRVQVDVTGREELRSGVPWDLLGGEGETVRIAFRPSGSYGVFVGESARLIVSGYVPDASEGGWAPVDLVVWIAVCPDGVPTPVHETAQVLLWDGGLSWKQSYVAAGKLA